MIHFCGVIFYAFFASGELQSWAEPMAIAGADPAAGGPALPPGSLIPGQTVIGPSGVGIADPSMMQQQGWNAAAGAGVNPFAQPNGTAASYAAQQQQPSAYAATADPSQQYQQSWTTTADPLQAAQATWN
jgi:hypothetical protein